MKKIVLILVFLFALSSNAAEKNIRASGTPATNNGCGDNCSWTLYDDGTFEMTGSGTMYNYSNVLGTKTYWTISDDAPWSAYIGDIKSISIGPEITNIGTCAFAGAYSLKSVDIPNNITSINFGAFLTSNLEEVRLPDTLSTIEGWAFNTNHSLESINIPDSLTIINGGLLAASNLEYFVFPDTVERISNQIFDGSRNLKSIVIGENVTDIWSDAFIATGNNVVIYCEDKTKGRCSSLMEGKTGEDKLQLFRKNESGYYVLTDLDGNDITDSKGNPIYYANLDLMAHGAACTDEQNCRDILASNGQPFKVGSKIYNSIDDFAKGNNVKFRIYTIEEANLVAKPTGNTVRIKYR